VQGQFQLAANGFRQDMIFGRKALFPNKTRKTAGAVAAVFYFTAIGVVNPVKKICIGVSGRFDQQYLVTTDTGVSVGQLADKLGIDTRSLGDQIDQDKIIAQAVHFAEVENHMTYGQEKTE
jgi:hypothetical protein